MLTAFQATAFQNNAFQISGTPITAFSGHSIVLPVGISFYNWASTLLTDFSTEEIPIPPKNENDWQPWASRVFARSVFSNDAIPNPLFFNDWRLWASRVCQAVNG